jgi:hypothetical protein
MPRWSALTLMALALIALCAVGFVAAPQAHARPAFQLTVNRPLTPAPGDTVTLKAVVRRNDGSAIRGARVKFTWNLAGTVVTTVSTSNDRGIAVCHRLITCSGTVTAHIRATWNGRARAVDPALRWTVPGHT